jgi:hypothetical protein
LGRVKPNGAEVEKPTKEGSVIIFFFFYRAPRERKEAGTMPSAVRGAASPWFTGAGSDLLVVKVSVKYLYATT